MWCMCISVYVHFLCPYGVHLLVFRPCSLMLVYSGAVSRHSIPTSHGTFCCSMFARNRRAVPSFPSPTKSLHVTIHEPSSHCAPSQSEACPRKIGKKGSGKKVAAWRERERESRALRACIALSSRRIYQTKSTPWAGYGHPVRRHPLASLRLPHPRRLLPLSRSHHRHRVPAATLTMTAS